MKCEMTFFTKAKLNLKNKETIASIENKTKKLITEELKDNEFFSFSSTKKENY